MKVAPGGLALPAALPRGAGPADAAELAIACGDPPDWAPMSHGVEASTPPSARRRALRYAALGCAAAAVLLFYSWAASPRRELFGEFSGGPSYYNYLVRGFRSGHLSLQADLPAGLLKLKDPYDPVQNAAFGLHDISLYKGRLYLYFGVAPALAAYWPFAALSGRYLEDPQALFLFCA